MTRRAAADCWSHLGKPAASARGYYGQLDVSAPTGASVVFGFRAQAFVTRANVAAVSGVENGSPALEGVWAVAGRRVSPS